MTRLIEILISLAIVAVLFVVVGVVLPASRHVSESVETNRKMTIVYDTLNSLRRFDNWNPLALRDPNMQFKRSGPDSGVGARLDYASELPGVGQGSWEIVATEPNQSVSYALNDVHRGDNKRTRFTLRPTGRAGRNVEITQTYDVDYGWNLLGRYSGMYVSSNVGQEIKLGLSRLTNMLASVPNYDYTELSKDDPSRAPSVAARPAETLLFVTASVPRDNEAVASQMKGNLEWINKVIAANGLQATGPVRIITNEFGAESYSFDVAVPVRKRSGAAATEAAGDEAQVATDSGPAAVASDLNINLEGPVEIMQSPASQVALAPFKGHMANLSMVRDALRGWALTRGYTTVDRPYEAWKSGVEGGFTEEGEFDVYWTLAQ
ncbi:MAG: SRPBCC family protein [Pseudomonadota bacterium]|nr:SRPBCC family protein [Pseudomonadota bacterium]